MLFRMLNAVLAALAAALRLPGNLVAALLGIQPKATAADLAEEALAAAAASPTPLAPLGSAVQRKPCPVAELVADHARKRLYFHEDRSYLSPLPYALRTWLDGLTTKQLTDVVGARPERLQEHINAGLSGSTALGPYGLPPILPAPEFTSRTAEREGRGGKGGGPSVETMNLADLLQDAGYSPSPRPRF